MSWRHGVILTTKQREAFGAVHAFLLGRMNRYETIDWALSLQPTDFVKKLAVLQLLQGYSREKVKEPWLSAWRLIEEFWEQSKELDPAIAVIRLNERIDAGDQSGMLCDEIVKLVVPRLELKPFRGTGPRLISKKGFRRFFAANITSSLTTGLNGLNLSALPEEFLENLAHRMEASVIHCVDLAHRVTGGDKDQAWRMLKVNRVYFAGNAEDDELDPDMYIPGIAPSIKLLHAVLRELSKDPRRTRKFMSMWRDPVTRLHKRLWAALAIDGNLATNTDVGDFLEDLNDVEFWEIMEYPEFATLRARRFQSLSDSVKHRLVARLMHGPSAKNLSWVEAGKDLGPYKRYWSVCELRRIVSAGGQLDEMTIDWLNERVVEFPDLMDGFDVESGFLQGGKTYLVEPNPDDHLDSVIGQIRLAAFENAQNREYAFRTDSATRARDWLRANRQNILSLLEDVDNNLADLEKFPKTLGELFYAHAQIRIGQTNQPEIVETFAEVSRFLNLINVLPDVMLPPLIDAIASWLSNWCDEFSKTPQFDETWHRLWPVAVLVTNEPQDERDAIQNAAEYLDIPDRDERTDIDTLNSPAGKLIGNFMRVCPDLTITPQPFVTNRNLQTMRDAILAVPGRSGLIAKHRLISGLGYYNLADAAWVRDQLLPNLMRDDDEALILWGALARRRLVTETMLLLGDALIERANDKRLGREFRKNLVFSIVIESLYAFKNGSAPAIPNAKTSQLIRTLDEEIRTHAAHAVYLFAKDAPPVAPVHSPAQTFISAVEPFIRTVWPQEKSLTTLGVSSAFAKIPSVSGEMFVNAVTLIKRFLVPFQAWSLLDYGLYGQTADTPKLAAINSAEKAAAFLNLLNLTIGNQSGDVVPHELDLALEHIRKTVPSLAYNSAFRRLSTLTRRYA